MRLMADRLVRSAATLLACLVLAGCWFSPAPLLNSGNASLIPFAGSYKDPDGKGQAITIGRAEAPNAYRLSQGDTVFDVFALSVDGEWYVMQMADPVTEPQPVDNSSELEMTRNPTEIAGYTLLRWSGGELRAYKNECTERIAAVEGVEETDFGCIFADVDALRDAARLFADILEEDPDAVETTLLEPVAP